MTKAPRTGSSGREQREPPRLEEPLSWSVPVARLGDTTIRVHAFLLATIIVVLIRAAWHAGDDAFPLGPRLAAIMLGSMVGVVFLHELVTLWAMRRLGGDLPEIVLQPLGGLDDGVAPPGWRRTATAAIVGPLTAVTIAVAAAIVVVAVTGGAASPGGWSLAGIYSPAVAASGWLEAVYLLGAVASVIAFANLLPAPPFRGRLLLEALLRPQLGPTRARRATMRLGAATAIVLAVVGILGLWLPPVLVAVMCGAALLREHRRDTAVVEAFGGEDAITIADLRTDAAVEQDEADAEASLERKRREDEADRRREENDELDRVLDKIATEGLEALDRQERRILDRATRRRRQSGD